MTLAATDQRERLRRRSKLLVWATIVWNGLEGIVAIAAGAVAGSAALIGFGLDSTVEVSAAVVALWYLAGDDDERGRRASRLIAVSFFALATYVSFDALRDLGAGADPDTSIAGIVITALSALVMPWLASAKRRAGQALGSKALVAESAETALCAYLSIAVLAGLVLDAVLGWGWADPVAALGVAALAVREGREAWRHGLEDCC